MVTSPTNIWLAEVHRQDLLAEAARRQRIAQARTPTAQALAWFPVVTDDRALTRAAGLVLALVTLVVSGDPAAAQVNLGGGH